MLRLETGTFLGANKRSFHAGGLVVSETEYTSKVFEGWHFHENNHITFIVHGGNREHRQNKEFEACPGSIIFYNSGEMHRNINTAHPSKNINLEIEESFLSTYAVKLTSPKPDFFNYADAKFALLKIYQECKTKDVHSIASIHALILSLLHQTMEGKSEDASPVWVKSIREILHDRWNEMVSLQELACSLGLHPVTVSKHFPRYFNCTLGEYMRKIKIEKSITQISNDQLSLTEVAHNCGFFDQSHFIRTFKQATGFLPGEYKKL